MNPLKTYLKSVQTAYANGNEESGYYAPISTLLAYFEMTAKDVSSGRKGELGANPDIVLWQAGEDTAETPPFAAVEGKRIGSIDDRANTQALVSSRKYGNVILTNNLEWQFWRLENGTPIMYEQIQILQRQNNEISLINANCERFIILLNEFSLQNPQNISNPSQLATYMARRATKIKRIIFECLHAPKTAISSELNKLKTLMEKQLNVTPNDSDFADMYAQTIVYALFIARYNKPTEPNFTRYAAIEQLHSETELLSEFFSHIAMSRQTAPTLFSVIDNLCQLFQICNVSALLNSQNSDEKDPIIHFYENFLQEYSPALRRQMGVFYTPPQIVRFLVKTVDNILINDFGIIGGLANNDTIEISENEKNSENEKIAPRMAILDPACGTGAFHTEIIKHVQNYYSNQNGQTAYFGDYLANGLLERLIGFEIMMTSYAVAHLNVRRTVAHLPGISTTPKIYFTNTLNSVLSEKVENAQMTLDDDALNKIYLDPLQSAVLKGFLNADIWKSRQPIKVIIGNPPYFAASQNRFSEIDHYKLETDGVKKLQEKNSKWLNDDYVKFFRFAEKTINRSKEGVLAFVTNNGFLDNPTFRGMRASLLRSFDKIFIVNLHGNARKQEKTPTGGKDENVFDIMQGVSLFVGVKISENEDWATVHYADLWGLRKEKFAALELENFTFEQLTINPKMAYFVPFGGNVIEEYEKNISLADLFPVNAAGITTSNDNIAIASTKEEIEHRVEIVKNATDNNAILNLFGTFASNQTAETIKNDILFSNGIIAKMAFRPFDTRWTFYSGRSCGWMRRPGKKNIVGQLTKSSSTPIEKNVGLLFSKQIPSNSDFGHIFITDILVDINFLQIRGGTYIAPLYLQDENGNWQPNISENEKNRLTANLAEPPQPLEILDYCYGVLHSPKYRAEYNENLKKNFPKVPIPASTTEFEKYKQAGERLRRLHLLEKKKPLPLQLNPDNKENLKIDKISYKDGILRINKHKQILGIPQNVWTVRIGGYQVLDKWLKSHKGEELGFAEFEHLQVVAGCLAEMLAVVGEI
ncbi:MAG: N-6 DNA methylase [Firmicutes bacterium]|nr:N-6 DNA methylase [Bacillota bacterium]